MSEQRALALVQVPFHGRMLGAIQDANGVWVPAVYPCDHLGLDLASQIRRLKKKPWARAVMMTVRDASGRHQETWCIHLDSLAMWLATIEVSRVKSELREMLELYQKEAARVLADYFMGRASTGVQPVNTDAFAAHLKQLAAQTISDARGAMLGMAQTVKDDIRDSLNNEIVPAVLARLAVKHPEPHFSINDCLAMMGYACDEKRKAQIRELISVKRRRMNLSPYPTRDGSHPGAEWIFPESEVWIVKDAIDQVWTRELRSRETPLLDGLHAAS